MDPSEDVSHRATADSTPKVGREPASRSRICCNGLLKSVFDWLYEQQLIL
jgi:hypothetical protein